MSTASTTEVLHENLGPEEIARPAVAATRIRYHYLDNLRALAMLAGVLFHVGIGFSVLFENVWPVANSETSILFDYWVWFLHTFRMPLFFLIAGFFAHYLIIKRGAWGFVKNRLLRISLPFVIFWPLMTASIIGLLIYGAKYLDVNTPAVQMIRLAIENPEATAGPEPMTSTMHLWFIYYLSIFCLSAAVIYKLCHFGQAFYRIVTSAWMLFLGLPLLAAVALSRVAVPHPAADHLVPAPWALVFFGLFFTVGWAMFVQQDLLDRIRGAWRYLAASSLVAAVVLAAELPEPWAFEAAAQLHDPQELSLSHLLRIAATAVLSCHMSFLCLLAGHRVLNRKSTLLRYMADGSYWVYIVHLPILFYLQLVFHGVDLPLVVEFLLISALTLGAGYLSYAILVRHTPIGWLLNGRRRSNADPEPLATRSA